MEPKTPVEKERMSRVPYAGAIGRLIYAIMCTKPDIIYVVGLVSQFNQTQDLSWKEVKMILRYLKGMMNYILVYRGKDLWLFGYFDIDSGGDVHERKSTLGYAFILNGGAISWKSKKQTCHALSIIEAEYITCCLAVQEVVWLRRFYNICQLLSQHQNLSKFGVTI
ncbi:secreted RxLR effector protein 161-like [Tripterygium wilfordii]|uniref:secreted RxLR effector protein 161-like n=1 Tax=Tripterygium wilfordii TaxID=458696 RepID=UPI0018F85FE7|nr:secreted RxLR effector protein 161-like [Tripterygium wilfordii]